MSSLDIINKKVDNYKKRFYFILIICLIILLFIIYSNFKFIINNAKYILLIGFIGYIYKLMNIKKEKLIENLHGDDISKKNNINEDFKKFVYSIICQCKNQCPPDDEYNLTEKENEQNIICSEIKIESNKSSAHYHHYIENAFEYLINNNYLVKRDQNYYIKSDNDFLLKLTWENIKSLNSDKQKIYWLFRKLIVDCLLKKIYYLKSKKDKQFQMNIYSVGSTNLTSDYDITLYGNNQDKINIMENFQKEFKLFFNEDSSIVFDTNIYGKAYIEFKNPYNEYCYTEYDGSNCKNKTQNFYYLNSSSNNFSCLMWGLIKYLRDFIEGFDESLYHKLYYYMEKSIPNIKEFLKNCNNTLLYLQNQANNINYISLFNLENIIINKYKINNDLDSINELTALHDYISIINFYGSETYFTRGAFIDTVVNVQMCNSESNKILLSEVDYICSILENSGFFFIHNYKTKYFIRVFKTLNLLIENYNIYSSIKNHKTYIKMSKLLTKLKTGVNDYDSKYCNIKEDFDLKKCEKFRIFNYIISINNLLLTIFFQNNNYNIEDMYFYNKIVQQNLLDDLHTASKVSNYSNLWVSSTKDTRNRQNTLTEMPYYNNDNDLSIEDIEDNRDRSKTM
jgi:hypothetical protein